MAPNTLIPPIYNSTFILHRLSPLHTAGVDQLLNAETLRAHGRRLADSLNGDLLGGFGSTIGKVDEAFTRSGQLKECRWTLLGQGDNDATLSSADGLDILTGIKIDIEYERAEYVALLLTGASAAENANNSNFTHLPLVLTRMPALLRTSLLEYLAVNVDTRAEPLFLSSSLICQTLESFLSECAKDSDSFQKTVKDVQLSLSFTAPAQPSLKTLDVAIRREDVPEFVKQGQTIASSDAPETGAVNGTFMAALQKYLLAHLALDISHNQVFISRVACGAFALGREGKVKLFPPASAMDDDGNFEGASAASKDATAKILQILLDAARGTP